MSQSSIHRVFLLSILRRATLETTDRNMPLAERQLFSEDSATPQYDTEARKEAPPIDRVFI